MSVWFTGTINNKTQRMVNIASLEKYTMTRLSPID